MNALLAIGWEPELRGVLTIIIAVVTLCGSVYMILGTNMGARLAFLVSLAALAGWMFIMGAIWWTYGKGLLGEAPSWAATGPTTVIQDAEELSKVGVLDAPVLVDDEADPVGAATKVDEQFVDEDWKKLNPAAGSFQQAGAAATVLLEEAGAFEAGQFEVVNVFDKGGERSPQFFNGSVDFLAFFHKPHYVVVEVAPLVEQRVEPGRAPARPVIDNTRPREYVYMIRDLGSLRKPAGLITIGSLIVFLMTCYMLHTRDRRVAQNRAALAIPERA
jgi:hypothetical protein